LQLLRGTGGSPFTTQADLFQCPQVGAQQESTDDLKRVHKAGTVDLDRFSCRLISSASVIPMPASLIKFTLSIAPVFERTKSPCHLAYNTAEFNASKQTMIF
jgi:hypothetical protein